MDILTFGDPALRKPCEKVVAITPELLRLVMEMLETMYQANGVGLAAPQVGRTEALCVIDVPSAAEKNPEQRAKNAAVEMPMVMFNPEIIAADGVQRDEEGCLSFPQIHAAVTRAKQVTVTYLDPKGERKTATVHGWLARAVQHELDHLAGVLFVDKLSAIQMIPLALRLKRLEEKAKSPKKKK